MTADGSMEALLALARRYIAQRGPRRPLLVGLTGAHAYGFPSADSDLDLKGIHGSPTEELVGLDPPPDTLDRMEIHEGLEMDLTSHEVGLAVRLLLKGNGNLLERLATPLQVVDSPEGRTLIAFLPRLASRRFGHHYVGFFRRKCQDAGAPGATVKDLLYAYRAALTGMHLMNTGCCVLDVRVLADQYGYRRVADLVEEKSRGAEHAASGDPRAVTSDLDRLRGDLDTARARSRLPDSPPCHPDLAAWLLDLRRRFVGPWAP